MNKYFGSCILLIILLSSCKTSKPVRPMEIYNSVNDIPASAINVPVDLELDELEKMVNEQVGQLLVNQGDNITGTNDDFDVRIEKSGDIELAVQGNAINIKVPLRLFIQKDIGLTIVKGEGDLELFFLTDYKITKNWELTTQTSIDKYNWKKKPIVKLGMINIPIESIANKLVDRSKETVAREIDKKLQENFALREYLEPVWKKLQEPIQISDEYDAWIKVIPTKAGMTPLVTEQRKISTTLIVETDAKVILGGFNADTTSLLPLLPFSEVAQANDDYHLRLKTAIPYKAAEALAKKELIGQTFEEGGRKVTVKDIEIFGQKDQVVINTVLSGSFDGSLYLVGKPHYDRENEVLELKDLDFELKTSNFLHKSMAWIFQKGLKKKLKESLRMPIGDKKKEWKKAIEQQLTHLNIPSNIKMTADIDNLDIQDIFVEQEAVLLLVTAKGKVKLNIDNLEVLDEE